MAYDRDALQVSLVLRHTTEINGDMPAGLTWSGTHVLVRTTNADNVPALKFRYSSNFGKYFRGKKKHNSSRTVPTFTRDYFAFRRKETMHDAKAHTEPYRQKKKDRARASAFPENREEAVSDTKQITRATVRETVAVTTKRKGLWGNHEEWRRRVIDSSIAATSRCYTI